MALLNKVKGWTMHWERWVDANGSVQMDKPSFNAKVKLGDKTYSFGLGGLHSEDNPLVIEADETHAVTDIDVSSYYPGLVVGERSPPATSTPDIFCGVFADLMAARLEAKAKKQKEIAQGMKSPSTAAATASCRIAIRHSAIPRRAQRLRSTGNLSCCG